MATSETLGDRLRDLMKAHKLRNKDVAAAAGVHPGTVSYWLSDTQLPDDESLAPVAELLDTTIAYLRYGESPARANGTVGRVAEPTPPWPQEARVFVQEFLLEATREGANDEDLNYIRLVLTSPEAYLMYHGGRKREMTPDELRMEMEGLGAGLRKWLELRIQRRKKAERSGRA